MLRVYLEYPVEQRVEVAFQTRMRALRALRLGAQHLCDFRVLLLQLLQLLQLPLLRAAAWKRLLRVGPVSSLQLVHLALNFEVRADDILRNRARRQPGHRILCLLFSDGVASREDCFVGRILHQPKRSRVQAARIHHGTLQTRNVVARLPRLALHYIMRARDASCSRKLRHDLYANPPRGILDISHLVTRGRRGAYRSLNIASENCVLCHVAYNIASACAPRRCRAASALPAGAAAPSPLRLHLRHFVSLLVW